MTAVYALYTDSDAAQRAVEGLRAAGIAERDIVILSGDPIETQEFWRRDEATWMHWIAALGGVAGLVSGTLLTWMSERAWPLSTGNMPIVAWWPNLIIMFELTMLGAILATAATLLIAAKLPSRGPKLYDEAVTEGRILIGVERPPDASRPELERALVAGAECVKTI